MKLKKLLILTVVISLVTCFTAFSASAASGNPVKWVEVTKRNLEISGVEFLLKDLIKDVENPSAGYYEFNFRVEASDTNMVGSRYRISYDGGSEEISLTQQIIEETVVSSTLIGGNTTRPFAEGGTQRLRAEDVVNAADNSQTIRLSTNIHTRNFIIKDIEVLHFIDDDDQTGTLIYQMSKDSLIQEREAGEEIDGYELRGSRGFITVADAFYVIMEGDTAAPEPMDFGGIASVSDDNTPPVADDPPITDTGTAGEETPPVADGEETPPEIVSDGEETTPVVIDDPLADNSVSPILFALIAVVAVAVLGSAGGAVALSKG